MFVSGLKHLRREAPAAAMPWRGESFRRITAKGVPTFYTFASHRAVLRAAADPSPFCSQLSTLNSQLLGVLAAVLHEGKCPVSQGEGPPPECPLLMYLKWRATRWN